MGSILFAEITLLLLRRIALVYAAWGQNIPELAPSNFACNVLYERHAMKSNYKNVWQILWWDKFFCFTLPPPPHRPW